MCNLLLYILIRSDQSSIQQDVLKNLDKNPKEPSKKNSQDKKTIKYINGRARKLYALKKSGRFRGDADQSVLSKRPQREK